jgi:predicted alpha/beta superfamily hydrolase
MRRFLFLAAMFAGLAAQACSGGNTDDADSLESNATSSKAITVGGQQGWRHVEAGIKGGFFHTFDQLRLGTETPRKIQVFLPNGYDTGTKSYPVIVMNDGHTAFFNDDGTPQHNPWPKGYWRVGETLSDLYAKGKVREVIVIAVHPISVAGRQGEYTLDPIIAGPDRSNCCGLATYTKYMADQFMPWVQRNYRVSANAKERMILGASHGGLASTYIAMDRPDLFGIGAGMSSSVWVGVDNSFFEIPFTGVKVPIVGVNKFRNGSYYAHMVQKSALLKDANKRPKIYLDWGTRKMQDQVADTIEQAAGARSSELAGVLVSDFGYVKDKDVSTLVDSQGVHDESAWVKRFPGLVEKFFPKEVR